MLSIESCDYRPQDCAIITIKVVFFRYFLNKLLTSKTAKKGLSILLGQLNPFCQISSSDE